MENQEQKNEALIGGSELNAGLGITQLATLEPNILEIRNCDRQEVLKITPDGRIFWKQREIETDDEFKAAMLELRDALVKNSMPNV